MDSDDYHLWKWGRGAGKRFLCTKKKKNTCIKKLSNLEFTSTLSCTYAIGWWLIVGWLMYVHFWWSRFLEAGFFFSFLESKNEVWGFFFKEIYIYISTSRRFLIIILTLKKKTRWWWWRRKPYFHSLDNFFCFKLHKAIL